MKGLKNLKIKPLSQNKLAYAAIVAGVLLSSITPTMATTVWDNATTVSNSLVNIVTSLADISLIPFFLINLFLYFVVFKDEKSKSVQRKVIIGYTIFYVLAKNTALITGTINAVTGWFNGTETSAF